MSAPDQQTSDVPGKDDGKEKKNYRNFRVDSQSRSIKAFKKSAIKIAENHPGATVGYFAHSAYSGKFQGAVRHASGDTQFDLALFKAFADCVEEQNRRQAKGEVFNGSVHLELQPPVQDGFFQTVLHRAQKEGILSRLQAESFLECAKKVKKEADKGEDFRIKLLSGAGVTSPTYLCSED